jgi:hydrogenase maturation protease
VVGVGSPLGDDAVAWEIVRQLQRQVSGSGMEFHVVEGGPGLLDVLDGRGTLILVDALAASGPPGSVHRFVWPELRLEALRPGSTHHLKPVEALRLAATLNLLPEQVVIWAISGERFEPPSELSPAVATALPEVVHRIAAELQAAAGQGAADHA